MGNIANFLPSNNGLHYSNTSWPSVPDLTLSTPFGNIPIGNASNGLCGGMAFAVRDLFEAHVLPPASTLNPDDDSAAFQYLVNRLFSSFNMPGGVAEYYTWMNLPTHNTDLGPQGTSWLTIKNSMPTVRTTIDSGHLCPLALVCIHSTNPLDLGQNHQVLAYGYLDQGTTTTVYVYDSNHPNDNNVNISFNNSDPAHTTAFKYSTGDHNVLGFFTPSYTAVSPSPLFEDGNSQPPGWQSPAAQSALTGVANLVFTAFPNVNRVDFSAYYATNPADITTVGWHLIGSGTQQPDKTWRLQWDSSQIADQGNFGWGTVNIAAISYANGQQINPTVYRLFSTNNHKPAVGFITPSGHSAGGGDPVVGAQTTVSVYAPGASSVQITAYYATNPSEVSTVAWRAVGTVTNSVNGVFNYAWNTTAIPNQNNTGWGTVNLAATPTYNGVVAPANQRFYEVVNVQH